MNNVIEIAESSWAGDSVQHELLRTKPIQSMEYECRRWPYYLILPISLLLTVYVMLKKMVRKAVGLPPPETNTLWFDGLGESPRQVKEGAASWKALNEIYNYNFKRPPSLKAFIDSFWQGMLNCQAVRNRYKLVRKEFSQAVLKFADEKEVRIISLACGSAQAVVEVISGFKKNGLVVRAVLVDLSQEALEYAQQLAADHGVADQIVTKQVSVSQVVEIAEEFRPHVVEMLGLLDYFPQDKAIKLAKKVEQALELGGYFLTCNIAPNIERWFVLWVINWWMIYRRPSDLVEIALEANFTSFRLVYEPLQIHGVLIAEKR